MYVVYIIRLTGKKDFYIGMTSNLSRRLLEHQNGKVRSTRKRFDKLLHTEAFETKQSAFEREQFLKSGKGREWIKEKFTAW